jgi:hypothetical protein
MGDENLESAEYLKNMLNITEGTIVDSSLDLAFGSAPFIGKVYQTYQMMKLKKQMVINGKQLQVIKEKVENSANEPFYKSEVFPLIVKKLMEEDEDEKAKVIIDGFEHFIDEDLNEIEKIYHYYDVLSELRYSDIMLFVERYMPLSMRNTTELRLNIQIPSPEEMRSGAYKEKKSINSYQTNKLERLGLIQTIAFSNDDDEDDITKQDTPITNFGKQFLLFFALDESSEE